ncbi:MAG: PadR family transcriptional regulator [Clostridia bacterium]|nr:PadR family transcriptional regulator [Clostridia bacterium]
MDIQLKRGYIEICVLASMLKEETYGYKLIKDVSYVMDISESTLYPILKRLEASGCVSSRNAEYNSRLRKYYSITNIGRERIKEFMSDWNDVMKIYEYIKGECDCE